MIPSDPNFGSGFDPEVFTQAILSVQQMGTPNRVEERATFIWEDKVEYANVDSRGVPYDVNEEPSRFLKGKEIQAICSYEFVDRAGNDTAIGQFNNDRLVVTMLGVEYERVAGHHKARFGGSLYSLTKVAPPIALFGVDVYELHYQADDES